MTKLPDVAALELALDNGWLTIWFNQPEKRNPLTAEMTGELRAVLERVHDDRAVRGITLRGRGGIFCAGGDLKAFNAHARGETTADEVLTMSREGGALFGLVDGMPQVVLAVIEGAAMAGGFGLACCADAVICEAKARFAMTETAIGLSPAQIAPFVIQKLGFATARRLMLTAARFTGKDAQALGFADFVADDAAGLAAIEEQIKAQVLGCAPGAVADTKALILALKDMSRAEIIDAAALNFTGRMMSGEAREGIAAFFEKRKPNWTVTP